MKHRAWTCGAAVLICLGLTARTYAFLGFGDIVFDPSVYAQAVEQVIRLEQQYVQLVRSYDQMIWNAKRVPVNMAARYRAIVTPWRNTSAADSYNRTASWIRAINTGQDVA